MEDNQPFSLRFPAEAGQQPCISSIPSAACDARLSTWRWHSVTSRDPSHDICPDPGLNVGKFPLSQRPISVSISHGSFSSSSGSSGSSSSPSGESGSLDGGGPGGPGGNVPGGIVPPGKSTHPGPKQEPPPEQPSPMQLQLGPGGKHNRAGVQPNSHSLPQLL